VFSNNLDIDEYVNYLLGGSFFVATFANFHYPLLQKSVPLVSANGPPFGAASLWISFIVMAMFCGHFFSMVVRYIVRPVINAALGDPEQAILPPLDRPAWYCTPVACNGFFTDDFRAAIAAKFAEVFKTSVADEGTRQSAPRLIRAYVLHNSPSAEKQRGAVIRPRSFTANLAMAFVFSSLIAIGLAPWQAHAFLWIGAVLLVIKQRSLDEREAKELYTHFLAVG
jgi:hypothetical protein